MKLKNVYDFWQIHGVKSYFRRNKSSAPTVSRLVIKAIKSKPYDFLDQSYPPV